MTGSGGYLLIAGASLVEGWTPSVCFGGGAGCRAAAYGFSFQVNTVGGVDEAIENGVGQGWAADDLMMPPFVNGRYDVSVL